MPPSSTVPSPSASNLDAPEVAPLPEVLNRVATRVQHRLTAEQSASNRTGDGAHAASVSWPWPL
ncbi:HaaA family cyclophane-containing RiPP peptide [Streptomyces sp. Je 1-332]|uniref:HaaA family cyclophane-containing RiPP peptide n=1 Tax=Streptomyces sp. Je 1-332 TaxID=3231270 RepID=UPI003459DA6E